MTGRAVLGFVLNFFPVFSNVRVDGVLEVRDGFFRASIKLNDKKTDIIISLVSEEHPFH